MNTQVSFEIRTCIKGRINLKTSGLQTYNELCQIHTTSAVSKTLVFRWYRKFTNPKDGSPPGQSKTVVINANSAAVAYLIKRDTRHIEKYCSLC